MVKVGDLATVHGSNVVVESIQREAGTVFVIADGGHMNGYGYFTAWFNVKERK